MVRPQESSVSEGQGGGPGSRENHQALQAPQVHGKEQSLHSSAKSLRCRYQHGAGQVDGVYAVETGRTRRQHENLCEDLVPSQHPRPHLHSHNTKHYHGEEQEGRKTLEILGANQRDRVTYRGSDRDWIEITYWCLHPAKQRHVRKIRLSKGRNKARNKKK